MAIILGGNGVDAEVVIGPNIVTDGLVFYIDPADTNSLLPKSNLALTEGVEIDYVYGLLGDTQKIKFTATTYPYYSSAKQGYLTTGVSTNDDFYGTLSKPVLLGSEYTLDIWIAPKVNGSYVGSVWLSGQDNLRINPAVNRLLLQVLDNGIATYGHSSLIRSIVQSKWTNITVTINPTTASALYYVDGIYKGKGPQSVTPIDMTLEFIGTSIYTISSADGDMGPIKAYNRALTAQEVYQNYNAIKKRYII